MAALRVRVAALPRPGTGRAGRLRAAPLDIHNLSMNCITNTCGNSDFGFEGTRNAAGGSGPDPVWRPTRTQLRSCSRPRGPLPCAASAQRALPPGLETGSTEWGRSWEWSAFQLESCSNRTPHTPQRFLFAACQICSQLLWMWMTAPKTFAATAHHSGYVRTPCVPRGRKNFPVLVDGASFRRMFKIVTNVL